MRKKVFSTVVLIGLFCLSSDVFAKFGLDKKFEKFKSPFKVDKSINEDEHVIKQTPAAPETPVTSPGAGGEKTVQGVSGVRMRVPQDWSIIKDEKNLFSVMGPAGSGASVSLNMNDYGQGFPVEASLKSYRESALKEKQEGKIESHQDRAVGGVLGVERVEAPVSDPGDPRRITWTGYKGTVGINLVAASRSSDFDRYRNLLNQIINSIRFE
jgi:hypothetical protein